MKYLYMLSLPFTGLFYLLVKLVGKKLEQPENSTIVHQGEGAKVLTPAVDVEPYFMLDHALRNAERWRYAGIYAGFRRVTIINSTMAQDRRIGWDIDPSKDELKFVNSKTNIPVGRRR